jgi:hypothetical protein
VHDKVFSHAMVIDVDHSGRAFGAEHRMDGDRVATD